MIMVGGMCMKHVRNVSKLVVNFYQIGDFVCWQIFRHECKNKKKKQKNSWQILWLWKHFGFLLFVAKFMLCQPPGPQACFEYVLDLPAPTWVISVPARSLLDCCHHSVLYTYYVYMVYRQRCFYIWLSIYFQCCSVSTLHCRLHIIQTYIVQPNWRRKSIKIEQKSRNK